MEKILKENQEVWKVNFAPICVVNNEPRQILELQASQIGRNFSCNGMRDYDWNKRHACSQPIKRKPEFSGWEESNQGKTKKLSPAATFIK